MSNSQMIEKALTILLCNQRQCWEQGLSSQVLLMLGRHELARHFARDAVVRQLPDGRPGMIETEIAGADTAGFGEVLRAMVSVDARYAKAADHLADYLLNRAPRTPDGILYHLTDRQQVWADALYFLPTGLCALGYPDEAIKQFLGIHRRLWLPSKCLYAHMWDEVSQSLYRADAWSSGNGWAVAGMARLIHLLPDSHLEAKAWLADQLATHLHSMIRHQRPDGLFHDILDDQDSFVETNSAQMAAYAIYSGVADGYLDRAFLDNARLMQAAARRQIDQDGAVQGACSSPSFDKPGTSTEAQCFYIMMELAADAC